MTAATSVVRLRRRGVLQLLGLAAGGLALGLDPALAHADAVLPEGGFSPNAFVHVAPDGKVTIVCHRSEMGQGVRSSLHVLVADEMGAALDQVRVVQAVGDKKYGDQNTDGSSSVREGWDDLRRVGATARTMLVAAAAAAWKVPAAECTASKGSVTHARSKRSLPFKELVAAAAKLPVPDPKKVTFRPRNELEHVGKDLPLLDGPDIVTGRAGFGADTRLPGMLTAIIARPPVFGGKVARFDPAAALAVPGVRQVIALPVPSGPAKFQPLGGVAVLADNTWAAMRGRKALVIEWTHGDNATYDSAAYKNDLLAAVRAPGKVVRQVGDVDKALAGAARKVSAEYYLPHLVHAAMEPPAAVARFDNGACEVWATTQNPQAARTEVARVLGVDESKVTVHVTLLGGGFGRKSKPDYVAEAAFLARAASTPVRVQWTRTDDIQHAYYHAVSAQSLEAGLDATGKVVAWRHRSAFPPIPSIFDGKTDVPTEFEVGQGMADMPLAIPNIRAEAGQAKARVRIGWMRSVCNIFHGFAMGSFIDELAHARGIDPRDMWLEIIGSPRKATPEELGTPKVWNYGAKLEDHPVDVGRFRHVIERVTQLSDWTAARKSGRALGLSAHRSFLASIAVVASAVKGPDGKPRIDEAWLVADAGSIINAERVRAQMEGAVVFGMSIALHGNITARGGAIEQTNFRDYPVARIGEVPRRIHVEIVKSDAPSAGVGEPGVPPVAPAIANAFFALTGKRARELPLRHT